MKNIYCVIGPSGVGKTTITEYLEKHYGLQTVSSYTDRKPRYDGETGHRFLTEAQFDELPELVAYTKYNGHRYGVTSQIVDESDLYVIDPPGLREMVKKYRGTKGIKTIGLTANLDELRARMKRRGDDASAIETRLAHDVGWFAKRNLGFSYDFMVHADGIIPTAQAIYEYIKYTESTDYNVRLYQIHDDYDTEGVRFLGSNDLRKKYGGSRVCVNLSIYDEVWVGDVEFDSLEDAFRYFNADNRPNPEEYSSMSVSDIIEIHHNHNPQLNGRWFCDSVGFKKLSDDVYIPLE